MKKLIFFLIVLLSSFTSFALEYGLDRIHEPEITAKLENKNLAVLTHAAGRSKTGEHLIDILFHSFKLKKIFAPEHGLRTVEDDYVGDYTDEATGLPVISLYKHGTRAPSLTDLQGIDAIVIDLQDVGVRFYTYFSTVAEVMKAAAPLNIEVILLDRPNLLGGNTIEGKTLEEGLAGSFTAYHTIPTRHGMTLGELAQMINAEKKMNVKLTIVPVAGWNRENLLHSSERPWIAPSPALVEISQVGLYVMWGTLENFNLAVGRGSTNELAFKVLGAPWITIDESASLAKNLNALRFKNISFTPFSWKVTRAEYEGQIAFGVKVLWNGEEVRTDECTYKVAQVLIKMFSDRLNVSSLSPASLGSKSMLEAIKRQVPWPVYQKIIDQEITAFRFRRKPYLLY